MMVCTQEGEGSSGAALTSAAAATTSAANLPKGGVKEERDPWPGVVVKYVIMHTKINGNKCILLNLSFTSFVE